MHTCNLSGRWQRKPSETSDLFLLDNATLEAVPDGLLLLERDGSLLSLDFIEESAFTRDGDGE